METNKALEKYLALRAKTLKADVGTKGRGSLDHVLTVSSNQRLMTLRQIPLK